MPQNSNKNQPADIKREKDLKAAPMPPMPFEQHILRKEEEEKEAKEIERIAKKESPLTIAEASKLVENLRRRQEKLKKQLDELYQLRGVTPEYLRAYVTNPNNFSSREWEMLQKHRQSIMDSLNFSDEMKEKSEAIYPPSANSPSSSNKQSQQAKSTKVEKGRRKIGVANRRGWLPMH